MPKQNTLEEIAEAVSSIAKTVKSLRKGPLNEKALLLLIQHATVGKPSQRLIQAVLDGMETLDEQYLSEFEI